MGDVTIKTGKYKLSDHIFLDVTGHDGEVMISIHDLDRLLFYSAAISHGAVDFATLHDHSRRVGGVGNPVSITLASRYVDDPSEGYYLPSTGIKMDVVPADGGPALSLELLGAYSRGEEVCAIYRHRGGGTFSDETARLLPGGRVRLRVRNMSRCILMADWRRFSELEPGAYFIIRGRKWRKLDLSPLSEMLGDQAFVEVL